MTRKVVHILWACARSMVDPDGMSSDASYLKDFHKAAVTAIHDIYKTLGYTPQNLQWTILASFFLLRKPDVSAGTSGEIKVISIATGTKCLPLSKLSPRGEIINDSHAEVLARRGALRWFLEESQRMRKEPYESSWLKPRYAGAILQDGIELHLYVSTVPCMSPGSNYRCLNTTCHELQVATRRCGS